MPKTLKVSGLFLLAAILLIAPPPRRAEAVRQTIKMATLAPEGTTWANVLEETAREIKQQTQGRVRLKFYFGGQKGEELEIVEKMKIGELDAVGVMGMGLGQIVKSIRILDLPLLFDNYAEFDYTRLKLYDYFAREFEKAGYVLLGLCETGFIYVYSNKPIRELKDMEGIKMWAWKGEPLSQAMIEALKMNSVPLGVTDVLTSLQTGLIDACYGPPLGAIAMQWHTKVKYVSQFHLTNIAAGNILRKATFDKLIPADRQAVLEVSRRKNEELIPLLRRDNAEALKALLTTYGLTVSKPPTEKGLRQLKAATDSVEQRLIGDYYPKELLDRVHALIDECRTMGREKCRAAVDAMKAPYLKR